MSFRTIEVNLVNGRVEPRGNDHLPQRARGLLILLDESPHPEPKGKLVGLKKFLEGPGIPVTREQLREIMELDYYDQ